MAARRSVAMAVTAIGIAVAIGARSARCQTALAESFGADIARVPGATLTRLTEGRLLSVGGEAHLGRLEIWDASGRMLSSRDDGVCGYRSWHTATALPDGTVLIFGGIAPDGSVLGKPMVLEPNTGECRTVDNDDAWLPRAWHTTTLLVDGRVVIAGGESAIGGVLSDVGIWNPRDGTLRAAGALGEGRAGHSATLLVNGALLVWGGVGVAGRADDGSELFDPDAEIWTSMGSFVPPEDVGPPGIAVSVPPDGSVDVDPTTLIGIQFTKPMAVEAITGTPIQLVSPEGTIDARVVAAEDGMLLFVLPAQRLHQGTDYRLRLLALSDRAGVSMSPTEIRFSTGVSQASPGVSRPDSERPSPDAAVGDHDRRHHDDAADDEEWVPDADNLRGHWRSGRPDSPWQSLPALRAGRGVTALAGQVLRLNGRPLANVRLAIGSRTTRSDETGRFILRGISSGHLELVIDGEPTHGYFEVGVDVAQGQSNVLPFTIWLPKIDLANSVAIDSPTSQELVVTTPKIPHLQLRIPAGSVLVGHDGQPVRRVSITPIPIDRPPFPLPRDVTVPVYFTVQPGAAYVRNARSYGARLFYPNYRGEPAWMRFKFWHYDPDERGWFVYGFGTVTEDASQVVPDRGVSVYEFTGAMVADPDLGPPEGPPPDGCSEDGDPVDLATGLFVTRDTDLSVPDVMPLSLTRTYRQNDARCRAFGVGTSHPYDMFIVGSHQPWTYQEIILPDGGRLRYDRVCGGGLCNCPMPDPNGVCSYNNGYFEHTSTPGRFYKSTINWNETFGGWELKLTDGTVYTFPESECARFESRPDPKPSSAGVLSMRDRFGNTVWMTRDHSNSCSALGGKLVRIASSNGRSIRFEYENAPSGAGNPCVAGEVRIKAAEDNAGRRVEYRYDGLNRLMEVRRFVDDAGTVASTTYTYDGTSNRVATITDPRLNANECVPPACVPGLPTLTNTYDADGKVRTQRHADGGLFQFSYTTQNGSVLQTDVIGPRFTTVSRRVTFNAAGYCTQDSRFAPQGTKTLTYSRSPTSNPGSNLVSSTTELVTEGHARTTTYQYNGLGKPTSVARPEGLVTRFTYEPRYQQLQSIEDPLNHVTQFGYDAAARLVGITDATQRITRVGLNPRGQVQTVKTPVFVSDPNPVDEISTFEYQAGDLVAVTNPLGETSRRFPDVIGRVRRTTNALGAGTTYEYDKRDRPLRMVDALGGETRFTYDRNGNLTAVQDARGKITRYAYDNMNRLYSRTDPLNKVERYSYDADGHVTEYTDRRGRVAQFSYDGFGRQTIARYGVTGPSSQETHYTYLYDLADRLTGIIEQSVSNLFRTYDDADRVTSESNSVGIINYTYDMHRRQTLEAEPEAPRCFTYDAADRLLEIRPGGCSAAAAVRLEYDAAGRRQRLAVNAARATYGYDPASRLTSIQYERLTPSPTFVNALIYTYDTAGNRTTLGGEWARVTLPAPVTATYNDANRLTTWGAAAIAYDDNGNVVTDGSSSYTWNAQNQLTAIGGGSTASFQYDALGRRRRKVIGSGPGSSTTFLYDGPTAVQERGGSIRSILTGTGIDETLARDEANGARTLLTDALGSTIALMDAAGEVQTSYVYTPYGASSLVSPSESSSNPFQFTGRENDTPGLYYYRARYYAPTWGRFISEDPREYLDQHNLYGYAQENPLRFSDPNGEGPVAVGLCAAYDLYDAASTGAELSRLQSQILEIQKMLDRIDQCRTLSDIEKLELERKYEAAGAKLVAAKTRAKLLGIGKTIVISGVCVVATNPALP
jgi:RHS repeat-associated protein